MSQWITRVSSDPIWETMKSVGTALDIAAAHEGNDATDVDSLERIRAVLTFCGKRLAAMDPYLIEPAHLAPMAAAWTTIASELTAFTSNGAASHLTEANAKADITLNLLARENAPVNGGDLAFINESIGAYRSTLKKHLDEALSLSASMKRNAASVLSKQTELAAEIAIATERINTAKSEQSTTFTADQTSRAAEFTAAQAARELENAKSTAERDKAFIEAEAERQTQFSSSQEAITKKENETQTERQAQFMALMTAHTQKVTDQITETDAQLATGGKLFQDGLTELKDKYEISAQKTLDQIHLHKQEIEKLVGVIGNLGVTSGYQLVANSARTAIYVWQFLTVAALGGLVFVAYSIAFRPPEGDFFQGLASRIFLSITVGVFAAYAANQADKSAVVERKNRKLALELEAVGPYIAPLPLEMQNKFREALGERSFGVPEPGTSKAPDSSPSPANIIDVLKSKEFRDILDALSKATKDKSIGS